MVLTCDSPREDRDEASPSASGEPALTGWLRPSPIFARLRSRQHGGCASGRPWSCDKEYSKYLQGTSAACGADAARLQARIHACEKDCVHIRARSSTRGRAVCLNLNLACTRGARGIQHTTCNMQQTTCNRHSTCNTQLVTHKKQTWLARVPGSRGTRGAAPPRRHRGRRLQAQTAATPTASAPSHHRLRCRCWRTA
jgi:hypothetical protein